MISTDRSGILICRCRIAVKASGSAKGQLHATRRKEAGHRIASTLPQHDEWAEIESSNLQELPSVRPHPSPVDVVRIPRPDRIETFGPQVQRSLQRRRIMKAQIGAKPVDDAWFRHVRMQQKGGQKVERKWVSDREAIGIFLAIVT